MAAVRRISFFRRQVQESINPAVIELLLGDAARISEGQMAADGRYYGSTMLTIDLERLEPRVCDACDVGTAARLTRLLEHEPTLEQRSGQLALQEARRISGRDLRRAEADVRVRSEGLRVFVDVDLQAETARPAAGGRR
jgi:hypothetical protein